MEIDNEIPNAQEYKAYFLKKKKKKSKLGKTLEIALETRKFEIELYWKRSTYYWAFIASSFAGYFVVLNLKDHKELTIVVSTIGLFFSIGWYLANRGSKFWQKNWEAHVDLLEDEEIGPLFGTILNPIPIKLGKLAGEYPFSVSKINQILSFGIILTWVYIFSYSFDYVFNLVQNETAEKIINGIAFIGIFTWIGILFYQNAETELSRDFKKAYKQKGNSRLISRKK
ncbi:RipA family octameric membrane protein [Flagellimonas baculiformis]|uniref:RipA family octameric membrane protein n=1 Tax=Flagellimonas baculiformis TaxID=3067310 RepID=UPI00296FB783|nr:hypothetical protein [Muricauda sp. D6]